MQNQLDLFKKIALDNASKEEQTLSPFACKSNQGIRRTPQREKIADEENIRPIFFHDIDKIIHTLSYSRYVDKTQVFSLVENDHITHRALHVQFVSRIGRVIGRALHLNEDLIEAIALGHDIGHTPFGHEGERILNKICEENEIGYFCHNAQSVRALMELENRGQGKNLSLQVLDGILCHNGEMLQSNYKPGPPKSWKQFDSEYHRCFTDKNFSNTLCPMTLEGCVVRISDVIAYIGRDIEDAIRIKLINREDIPTRITQQLGNSNDIIINTLVLDLIKNSYNQDSLAFSPNIYEALQALMKFNYQQIYNNPKTKQEHEKISSMFRQLYKTYLTTPIDKKNNNSLFNKYVQGMSEEYRQKTEKKRMIIDFIAGMTDDFLINQFKTHFLPNEFGYSLQ